MNLQQTVILVATILGWVLLAGSIGFAVYVFAKIYLGRDKQAAEIKKQAELAKKEAKKEAKQAKPESRRKDTIPGNAELKQRLQARGEAPKRQEVVSRLAETTKASEELKPEVVEKVSVKNFLDDDIDEFDFAKRKATNKDSSPQTGNSNSPINFPPPPPRL